MLKTNSVKTWSLMWLLDDGKTWNGEECGREKLENGILQIVRKRWAGRLFAKKDLKTHENGIYHNLRKCAYPDGTASEYYPLKTILGNDLSWRRCKRLLIQLEEYLTIFPPKEIVIRLGGRLNQDFRRLVIAAQSRSWAQKCEEVVAGEQRRSNAEKKREGERIQKQEQKKREAAVGAERRRKRARERGAKRARVSQSPPAPSAKKPRPTLQPPAESNVELPPTAESWGDWARRVSGWRPWPFSGGHRTRKRRRRRRKRKTRRKRKRKRRTRRRRS